MGQETEAEQPAKTVEELQAEIRFLNWGGNLFHNCVQKLIPKLTCLGCGRPAEQCYVNYGTVSCGKCFSEAGVPLGGGDVIVYAADIIRCCECRIFAPVKKGEAPEYFQALRDAGWDWELSDDGDDWSDSDLFFCPKHKHLADPDACRNLIVPVLAERKAEDIEPIDW